MAATKGVASFVSVTVGIFIGAKLALLVMRAFRLWIALLEERLVVCSQRLSNLTGETEPDSPPEEHRGGPSALTVRLRIYSIALVGGSAGLGVGLVMLVIKTGTIGLYESDVYLAILATLAIALFGVLGTASELGRSTRATFRLERRLNDAENVPVTLVVVSPRQVDAAIQSTQSWVRKLTGVQGWQPGMATS